MLLFNSLFDRKVLCIQHLKIPFLVSDPKFIGRTTVDKALSFKILKFFLLLDCESFRVKKANHVVVEKRKQSLGRPSNQTDEAQTFQLVLSNELKLIVPIMDSSFNCSINAHRVQLGSICG
mmetsp:Transcript_35313/g.34322  ORF Transcript_35313/g.34322 Transcript_35313/m.34322 type:complete len:121 (+) Transcript_35313:370-732(+)